MALIKHVQYSNGWAGGNRPLEMNRLLTLLSNPAITSELIPQNQRNKVGEGLRLKNIQLVLNLDFGRV